MARIRPLIRKIFKGDDNAAAAAVGKFNMKTNKCPFQGALNYSSQTRFDCTGFQFTLFIITFNHVEFCLSHNLSGVIPKTDMFIKQRFNDKFERL